MDQYEINELCDEYASEISDLKAEIERLRAVLEEVGNIQWQGITPATGLRLRLMARAALKE